MPHRQTPWRPASKSMAALGSVWRLIQGAGISVSARLHLCRAGTNQTPLGEKKPQQKSGEASSTLFFFEKKDLLAWEENGIIVLHLMTGPWAAGAWTVTSRQGRSPQFSTGGGEAREQRQWAQASGTSPPNIKHLFTGDISFQRMPTSSRKVWEPCSFTPHAPTPPLSHPCLSIRLRPVEGHWEEVSL